MILANRICGQSGIIKTIVVGRPQWATCTFVLGLLFGGHSLFAKLPEAYESVDPEADTCKLVCGGFLVGAGTTLSNGCTSGHGLCGLSRLSLRSFAAVVTFVLAAIISASSADDFSVGSLNIVVTETPEETLKLATQLAGALTAAYFGALLFTAPGTLLRDIMSGLWAGTCSAVGFGIGGMAKPSIVLGGLSLANFDATLWLVFCSGLATTFVGYRIAELQEETPPTRARSGTVDAKLILGAMLFGIGWGMIGTCPGPHVSTLGALPASMGHWYALMGVAVGMHGAAFFV